MIAPKKKSAPKKKELPDTNTAPAKKKTAAKKKSAPKKATTNLEISSSIPPEITTSSPKASSTPAKKKVYSLAELRNLPDHYNRDLIKLLLKNPTQAYVFWEVSEQTVKEKLKGNQELIQSVQWELILTYTNDLGEEVYDAIKLQPYTKNYFLNFLNPVENLRASIELKHPDGKRTILLQSGAITLPPKKIALKWHKDWTPESVLKGSKWKTSPSGEFYYLEEEMPVSELSIIVPTRVNSSWSGGSSGTGSSWEGGSPTKLKS